MYTLLKLILYFSQMKDLANEKVMFTFGTYTFLVPLVRVIRLGDFNAGPLYNFTLFSLTVIMRFAKNARLTSIKLRDGGSTRKNPR